MASNLLPFEYVIDQIECTTNNGKSQGIMIISNVRLLWKPIDEAIFTLQVPRFHPAMIKVRKNDAKLAKYRYMVMQIQQVGIDGSDIT